MTLIIEMDFEKVKVDEIKAIIAEKLNIPISNITITEGSIIITISMPEETDQTKLIEIINKTRDIKLTIPLKNGTIIVKTPVVKLDNKLNEIDMRLSTHQRNNSKDSLVDIIKLGGSGYLQYKTQGDANMFIPEIDIN